MTNSSKVQSAIHWLLAAGAIACLPSTAGAQSLDVPTERISVRDLDLTTTAGVARLDRRIRAAARRVCESETSANRLRIVLTERCKAKAVADAAPARNNVIKRAGVTLPKSDAAGWQWIAATNARAGQQ